MSKKKLPSQEFGLIGGLILGKYFFKTEDLHYGYWPPDLEVCVENFPKAQEQHSDLIIKHIPEGTKTILDVGCGVGVLADKLKKKGFEVECVSPSPLLTERARARLGTDTIIHECLFEEVETDKTYDLILFSESFQYVRVSKSLPLITSLLTANGHLLICDFFKKEMPDKGLLGGGHKLKRFYSTMEAQPFEKLQDIDITEETAPNIDLLSEMTQEVGVPLWNLFNHALERNRPWISKFLKWKFRKKIPKIESQYLNEKRNADEFRKYKSYRLLLFGKTT